MPELPEVETIKRGLARLLPGKAIAAVSHDNAKSFPNSEADVGKFLIGASVVAVNRRAKVLLVELESKYSLVIHLKMTGQLVFVGESQKGRGGTTSNLRFAAGHPNDSLVGKLPDKSTRVIFRFQDNSYLYFNDQRKFGWVRLLPTAEVAQLDFFQRVGPEPLSEEFTWHELKTRLGHRQRSPIKAALLDQAVIAGVGNIYADESLWEAKIHPATPVSDLADPTIKSLFRAIRTVLQRGIDQGGSTDRTYVDAEGRRGNYLQFAKVFRQEGKPCPRCGTLIRKVRLAGRGTHLCPYCQQLPRQLS